MDRDEAREHAEDPLIAELERFIWTWAEHDDECPARTLQVPEVMDAANCDCGLILRMHEMMAKVAARIAASN